MSDSINDSVPFYLIQQGLPLNSQDGLTAKQRRKLERQKIRERRRLQKEQKAQNGPTGSSGNITPNPPQAQNAQIIADPEPEEETKTTIIKKKKGSSKYDPFKSPPNIELAKRHGVIFF